MTELTTSITGFAIIALILFAAFNGLVIKWYNTKGSPAQLLTDEATKLRDRDLRMWSAWWHRCGLVIRVCIWLIVWLASRNWFLFTGIIAADSFAFPVIINLINNLKWYYVGTTAKTDILIRKIFTFVNFDK